MDEIGVGAAIGVGVIPYSATSIAHTIVLATSLQPVDRVGMFNAVQIFLVAGLGALLKLRMPK